MQTDDLLHNIDKRLAVLEAITKEHSSLAEKNFISLREDSEEIKSELSKLRMRVAGIAGGISAGIAIISQLLR